MCIVLFNHATHTEVRTINLKINKRHLLIDYLPMALTATLIIASAVWKEQSFLKTLPTLITLAVQILLARANRLTFLLGGANSILYALSYFEETLYLQALSATVISMPVQIYSYFNWKKNSVSNSPKLRELSPLHKLLIAVGIVAGWLIGNRFIGNMMRDAKYATADVLLFIMGIVVTFLSAFRFVDAQYLSLISGVLSLCLWIRIAIESPQNVNYVVIAAYNLFRHIETLINWSKLTVKNTSVKRGNVNETKSYT